MMLYEVIKWKQGRKVMQEVLVKTRWLEATD